MTGLRLERISDRLDRVSIVSGRAVSWLTLGMVVVTVVIVVMRYVFGAGLIWLQESLTWMHGAVFMLGAAYTLQRDEHVRVDVFYRAMSERRRAIVDLVGVVVFLVPLALLILAESLPYVERAWAIREVSRDAGGLPFPAIPLLKSVLLLMPLAILLQGVSMLLRSAARLMKG